MALLHFTSGTTGAPKGAIHVHEAVVAHHITGQYALDFHRDDVFWCTADPGWVTGTSYGIISPLTNGLTMVVDEAEFRTERWYQTLQDHEISNWYTAPTAIRMLMKAGAQRAKAYDLSSLRFIASVGEPLNPEAIVWAKEAYGLPIHDNWWQTETGGIMIANFAATDIKPGSMGRPMPGIEASVVEVGDDGAMEHLTEPGAEGELALRVGWPSMFRGYLHMEERYQKSFVDGWYLSGDVARRDEDRYVRQKRGLQPRARRLDAPVQQQAPAVRRQRHRRGRPAAGGGLGAGRQNAGRGPDHGPVDIDTARVRRAGGDLSLITYGGALPRVMEAAGRLAEEGVDAEVVDLRSLRPLDDQAILATVSKTRRAIIVEDAWKTGSISAEICARIVEHAFYELDAPIERICGAEVPTPYAKHLEQAAFPQVDDIVAAARSVVTAS
jgi:hypothetical protein